MSLNAVRRNIRLCLMFSLLQPMYFGTATLVLYYNSYGLGQTEINIFQATIAIVVVIGEIPGGNLVDRIGVRRIIIVGTVMQVIQAVLFCRSHGFWQIEGAVVLTGVAGCTLSGTARSLVVATLQSAIDNGEMSIDERTERYRKYVTHATITRCVGQLAGILGGGYIASHFNLSAPYVAQPFVYAIGVIVAWRIVDAPTPPRHRSQTSIRTTLRMMLKERKDIRGLVIVAAILNTVILSSQWQLQPALKQAGVPIVLFGWFFAMRVVLSMGLAPFARYLRYFGDIAAFGILIVVVTITSAIAGLADGWWGVVVAFIGQAFVLGFSGQLEDICLDKLLPSGPRNTRTCEESVSPAAKSLIFMGVSPLLGLVADYYSVGLAFLLIAGLAFCGGGWALLAFKKALKVNFEG